MADLPSPQSCNVLPAGTRRLIEGDIPAWSEPEIVVDESVANDFDTHLCIDQKKSLCAHLRRRSLGTPRGYDGDGNACFQLSVSGVTVNYLDRRDWGVLRLTAIRPNPESPPPGPEKDVLRKFTIQGGFHVVHHVLSRHGEEIITTIFGEVHPGMTVTLLGSATAAPNVAETARPEPAMAALGLLAPPMRRRTNDLPSAAAIIVGLAVLAEERSGCYGLGDAARGAAAPQGAAVSTQAGACDAAEPTVLVEAAIACLAGLDCLAPVIRESAGLDMLSGAASPAGTASAHPRRMSAEERRRWLQATRTRQFVIARGVGDDPLLSPSDTRRTAPTARGFGTRRSAGGTPGPVGERQRHTGCQPDRAGGDRRGRLLN